MAETYIAKMREALSDACYAMFNFLKTKIGGYEEMAKALDKAKSALADLPLNCDVGTADEQKKRFNEYCENSSCACCPLRTSVVYGFAWLQMPYEKGGRNEQQ